jgi:hypothetical protein
MEARESAILMALGFADPHARARVGAKAKKAAQRDVPI